jgi:serine/threonine protein kinase
VPRSLPESLDDVSAAYRTGVTSVTNATHMTMELCQFGDVFDIVKATGGFKNVDLVKFLFRQVLSGVNHLHSVGYSHLDLKLENILIGNDYKLKLCDLGFACKTSKQIR